MFKRKSKEEKASKHFLKKQHKKSKNEMRLVSQRKMNAVFIGGLAGIVLLSLFVIVSNLVGSSDDSQESVESSVVFGTDNVDYRLQQFLDGYVTAYFTVSDDYETRKEELETLNGYYDVIPTQNESSDDKQPTTLVSARLQTIKDNVAAYQITYDVGYEEMSRVTVKFSIPYGETDKGYYVAGLPWIEAVSDLKASDVDTDKALELSAADKFSDSESAKLDDFINLFFVNYTTSQKNLDLISNQLRAVTGVVFEKVEYVYYKETDNAMMAYVQVKFDIAGAKHNENFTLKLIQKDGDFYVDDLKHVIPADYAD
ncbi:conjugal transfer protein [Streptococcus sp. H31]|uniref:conjugal transfer protein n=1 Tax=Streptococcus huangxiaojuni TaxID=3237239 RepID=UPI0034A3EBBB